MRSVPRHLVAPCRRRLDTPLAHRPCLYEHAAQGLNRAQLASTTATSSSMRAQEKDNPYPFPAQKQPTPHQIFHLPPNASEGDIKARYYDLVRIYHPDKTSVSVTPDVAHARFQAITAAYDALRGKTEGGSGTGASAWAREEGYPTAAAWRAASHARRRQELYSGGKLDDRWKDRVFLGGVFLTVCFFVLQAARTRREAMADVVSRSQQATANVYDHKNRSTDPQLDRDLKRLSA
ncbi:hypothetical protein AX17_005706 [Amanita inopinata Kibby_2008]|nr:hypothetical protein AX17_005706 [Amanita inopinata Kibby_2008]